MNQRLTTQVNNGALGLAVEGGGMRSVGVHLMSAGGGEGPRPPQAIHNAGVKDWSARRQDGISRQRIRLVFSPAR